jgi:hypothetical protein
VKSPQSLRKADFEATLKKAGFEETLKGGQLRKMAPSVPKALRLLNLPLMTVAANPLTLIGFAVTVTSAADSAIAVLLVDRVWREYNIRLAISDIIFFKPFHGDHPCRPCTILFYSCGDSDLKCRKKMVNSTHIGFPVLYRKRCDCLSPLLKSPPQQHLWPSMASLRRVTSPADSAISDFSSEPKTRFCSMSFVSGLS